MKTKKIFYWMALVAATLTMFSCNKKDQTDELSMEESKLEFSQSSAQVQTASNELNKVEAVKVMQAFKAKNAGFDIKSANQPLSLYFKARQQKNMQQGLPDNFNPDYWLELSTLQRFTYMIDENGDLHFGTYTFKKGKKEPEYSPEPQNGIIVIFPYSTKTAQVGWTNIVEIDTEMSSKSSWDFEIKIGENSVYTSKTELIENNSQNAAKIAINIDAKFEARIANEFNINYANKLGISFITADSSMVIDNFNIEYQLKRNGLNIIKQLLLMQLNANTGIKVEASMAIANIEFRMKCIANAEQMKALENCKTNSEAEALFNQICTMELWTINNERIGKFVLHFDPNKIDNEPTIEFIFNDGTKGNPEQLIPELYNMFKDWIESSLDNAEGDE